MEPHAPNLARRAKRRAWAPVQRFFAVCAPGLEPVCARELKALGAQDLEAQEGGVAFSGRLEMVYKANLWLRAAGRVLLRLADFRVRGWRDLLRQGAAVPWEVYLPAGASLYVSVSLQQSNLKHSGRIAQELLAAASQRLSGLGLAPPRQATSADQAQQRVLVRAATRRCVFSLDTSGAHLHRRGYRLKPGKAPLREDLAAGLLHLAGFDPHEPLYDPMCGSGTLAIEAGLMARTLAPGRGRGFAFETWPAHRAATWQHLLSQAAEQARERPPAAILAGDRSAQALAAARQNAGRAGLDRQIDFRPGDFFAQPPPADEGMLVLNPPYGPRLGGPTPALASQIGRHLRERYSGWRYGLVLPGRAWLARLGLTPSGQVLVPHGGERVYLVWGQVP